MVVIVLQVAAQLLLGVYVLDADWPERPLALAFAILLGSAAFAAFGLVVTTVVRTAEGSSAVPSTCRPAWSWPRAASAGSPARASQARRAAVLP